MLPGQGAGSLAEGEVVLAGLDGGDGCLVTQSIATGRTLSTAVQMECANNALHELAVQLGGHQHPTQLALNCIEHALYFNEHRLWLGM